MGCSSCLGSQPREGGTGTGPRRLGRQCPGAAVPNLDRGTWGWGDAPPALGAGSPLGSRTGPVPPQRQALLASPLPWPVSVWGSTPLPTPLCVTPAWSASLCLSPSPCPALAVPVNRGSGALPHGPLAGSVPVRNLLWGRHVTLEGPQGLGASRPGCGPGPCTAWASALSLRSGGCEASATLAPGKV